MFEGHIGVKSERIAIKQTHNFTLALSYLEHRSGQKWFVLHVDPRVHLTGALSPDDFLVMLGFEKYPDTCPHLNRPCYFKPTHQVQSKSAGLPAVERDFNRFVESIHGLYQRALAFTTAAGDHSHFLRWGKQFSCKPEVLELEGQEPGWLAESRIEPHREAIEALEKADARVKHFQTIQYCLWGTDDGLVDSVRYILSELGLRAEKTKAGATVDLILDYQPKDVELGIEVTGISHKIDKGSKKITQALAYTQECERNCKAVILANTYRDTPVAQRTGLEHFTDPAKNLIKGMGSVGLTTLDLYRIWKEVTYGHADIHSIIGEMCDHEGGVYTYPG